MKNNTKVSCRIDYREPRPTSLERQLDRMLHDPIRLEYGFADDRTPGFRVKGVRLG